MTDIEDVMLRIVDRFQGGVTAMIVSPSLFEEMRNRYNRANMDNIAIGSMPFLTRDATELYFYGIQIVKGEPCPTSEKA